ncbi:MAG: zinc-binding dehydrogenase [Chitinophagales bacterium]|nr:zinc-binding dehydrogenase [Chitinophagales bacterium]
MKAVLLPGINESLQVVDHPEPRPDEGFALVRIRAAALNHRDVYIAQGQYAGISTPVIPGSDGAGEWDGRRVLIDPSLNWGSDPRAQGAQYRILGMPDNGTFAQWVSVPVENIHDCPAHLSFEQAAALPLAGVTAWRALFTRCNLQKGEKVFITGIGGGVALFAMQFALAAGAEVYVSSGSAEKIAKATALGATAGVNYREENWDKTLRSMAGGFDVVIDSAGGDGFAKLPALCNSGARIGIYGGTMGKVNGLSPQILFWKQISIHGSTMGNAADFAAMLQFVNQHRIIPVIDRVFEMEAVNDAYARMHHSEQFGKIVLRIS